MNQRVWNFSPGPATLPLAALERAREEFLNFQGTGMSVLEHSHRGKEYEAVHDEAIALLRELLSVPDNYDILLMQGGATMQFVFVPMNLLPTDRSADYVLTGAWSEKALSEAQALSKAQMIGHIQVAATTAVDGAYTRVPEQKELKLDSGAAYVHITTNNTIFGTQFKQYPDTGNVPLIADMSSDILSRKIDISRFGLIYAGAQKNLGPSGITVVIVRKDLAAQGRTDLPQIMRYAAHAKANSLLNTVPTFPVYMMRNVLAWVKGQGGIHWVEEHNHSKAKRLYDAIDAQPDFYRAPVEKASRSEMNVVFRLPSEELEQRFLSEAKTERLMGLKGHRSVGGIRASIYNSMPQEGVDALIDFMKRFSSKI